MRCPACAAENPPEHHFCDTCGEPLQSRCGRCNAVGRPGARFCGQCGAPIEVARAGGAPAAPETDSAPQVLTLPPRNRRAALDAERRRVTVLFAEMADAEGVAEQCSPEEAHKIMNRCFACITDAVQALEGTINQYTGEGAMALFGGATVLEDAPRRAVQSALDIQRALREYGRKLETERGLRVQMRIGLHTGVVAVGRGGEDLRIDYTAMGDTTMLAARLEQVAEPGTVLISGATCHLISEHFETADLGELNLEGLKGPIHAFRVLRPRPQRARLEVAAERRLTPLVGRSRELTSLIDLFERVKHGHGQVAFIAGVAGVGKSRLVYELRRELTLAGEDANWLEGRCVPTGHAMPLLPVIEQLRSLFDIDESDSSDELAAKVDAGVERLGELEAQAPYLRYLLAIDSPDGSAATMDASVRRARVFGALRAVAARSVQSHPAVYVFENLQWSDPSTEAYLDAALDAAADSRTLVIVTHRAGYTPPFAARGHFTTLTLRGLSDTDTVAMATGVLGATQFPADIRSTLLRKTKGVPLVVEELIRTLVDLGVLHAPNGEHRSVKAIGDVEVPDTIEDLILGRLDALGESARRTVQLAAVAGPRCTKRVLEAVVELPAQLDPLLAELARSEILFERGLHREPTYAFTHALLREAAYKSLSPQRRKELHRAVGHAIEKLSADRLVDHCAELAQHFADGELWAKAMEYAGMAAERAAHGYANSEAAELYGGALAAAEQLRPPADQLALASLCANSAAVLEALGDFDTGIERYEHALALLHAPADRHAAAHVQLAMADLFYNCHRPDPAQRYCEEAMTTATALEDSALQAACQATRAACISAWQGPIAEARRTAREAVDCAKQAADAHLRCRAAVLLGSILQWRGDFETCIPLLQDGVQLAEHLQLGDLRGQALSQLGAAYQSTGRYDQALRRYGALRHYAQSDNDTHWIARIPGMVGGALLDLYDLDAAIDLCRQGDEVAQQLSPWPEPRAHCLVTLGLAYLARGEPGTADTHLRRAEGLLDADSYGRWRWHVPLLRARAQLALAGGHLDEAVAVASQSLELAAQTDSRRDVAHAKVVLGEIAAAQGRLPEAEKLLRSAVALADHIHAARELWIAGGALGRTLGLMGQERAAETYLTQAAQTIESIATTLGDPELRAAFTRAAPVAEVYHCLGHRPLPSAGAA